MDSQALDKHKDSKKHNPRDIGKWVLEQQRRRVEVLSREVEKQRQILEATGDGLMRKLKEIESAKVYSYNEEQAKAKFREKRNKILAVAGFFGLVVTAGYGVSQLDYSSVGGVVSDGAKQFASVIGSMEDKALFDVKETQIVLSEAEPTAELWVYREDIGEPSSQAAAVRSVVPGSTPVSAAVDEKEPDNNTEPSSTTGGQGGSADWEFASRSSSGPVTYEMVGKISTTLSAPPRAKPEQPAAKAPAPVKQQAATPKQSEAAPVRAAAVSAQPGDDINTFEKNFRVVGGSSGAGKSATTIAQKPFGVFKAGDVIEGTKEKVLAVSPDGGLVTELRVIAKAEAQRLRAK